MKCHTCARQLVLSSNALAYRPTGETAHILQRHDKRMQRQLWHSRQDDLFEVQPTTKSPPPTTKALEQAYISSKQVFGRSPIQHHLMNFLSGIMRSLHLLRDSCCTGISSAALRPTVVGAARLTITAAATRAMLFCVDENAD